RQVHRRRVDGAHAEAAAALKASVLGLHLEYTLAHQVAVLGPGQAVRFRRGAEQLFPALVAQDVQRLRVVIMRVLVVADADAAVVEGDGGLAVLEPLLAQIALVLAGAEAAGDRRRGQRRPLAADGGFHAAAAQTVDHAAALRGGVAEVINRLVDDLLGHRDAGVAAGP